MQIGLFLSFSIKLITSFTNLLHLSINSKDSSISNSNKLCNYLIEKYPGAPANIDALFFLKKSYAKLDNVLSLSG